METEQSVQDYINKFNGDQKIYRLFYLTHQFSSMIPTAMNMILSTEKFRMLKDLIDRANKQQIQIPDSILIASKQRIEQLNRELLIQQNKIEKQIQTNKALQQKECLRQDYIELANLFMKYGATYEASTAFQQAFNNCTTPNNKDFILNWLLCNVWEQKEIQQKLNYYPPPQKLDEQNGQVHYQKYRVIIAIKSLQQFKYKECLETLVQVDYFELENDISQFSSFKDIGDYLLLCALIVYDRNSNSINYNKKKDILSMFNQQNIRTLVENNKEVLEIFDYFKKQNLNDFLVATNNLIVKKLISYKQSSHSFDHFIQRNLQDISSTIRDIQLVQYLKIYKSISIKTLCSFIDLGYNEMISLLQKIIIKNRLNILIDPIDGILIQKYTNEEQEKQSMLDISEQFQKEILKTYIKFLKQGLKENQFDYLD